MRAGKNPKQPQNPNDALRRCEQRFESVIELSSDWYWEQDEHCRFTLIKGNNLTSAGIDPNMYLGTARWDHAAVPASDGGSWDKHKAVLEARLPFADFVYTRANAQGELRYISASGQPVFDHQGLFCGYRGIARDATARRREEQLLALEHAVNRCLAEADSASGALQAAIRAVCQTQDWKCGRYFRVDEKAGVLRFADAWGVPGDAIERYIAASREVTYASGNGLAGRAWQSGQPQWVADLGKHARLALATRASVRGAFIFPVISEGKTMGVFSFTSDEVREPDARLLQAIRVIGSQIGQFLKREQAEQVLRESEGRFRSLTGLSSDMFWEQDDQYRFTSLTGVGSQVHQKTARLVVGKKRWEQNYLNMTSEDWAAHIATLKARQPFHDLELCRLDENGNKIWVSVSGEPVFDPSGTFTGYRGVGKDITRRKRAEQLRHLEHTVTRCLSEADSLSGALKAAMRAVCETEGWECGRYFRVDETAGLLRFSDAWGVPDAAIERYIAASRDVTYAMGTGLTGKVWQSGEPVWVSDRGEHAGVAQATFGSARDVFIFPLIADGKAVGVCTFISRKLRAPDAGLLVAVRVIGSQIGQFLKRKQAEERIQYLASHDVLTSLPNRAMFSEVLNLAIQNARRYNRAFAVLFIDLDRFKIINDTLGHEAGDMLLKEMGTRLSQSVRSGDVVGRLGGDEFVVLIQEVSEAQQVEPVARKILSAVIKPMVIQAQECSVTASIGICMYPLDAQDEPALMKNADIAMYRAKEDGKNTYKFYSEKMDARSFERLALEASLRRGLERSEFLLHYQAKLNLQTGRISGVEALVRWQHPEVGMVPPARFIPLAEETGLIVPIGRWVLNTACAQNVAWQREGLPPLRMAVNLSARQFADEDLLKDIAAALEQSGMKPELLEFELTESMVMQNPEQASKVLAAIKQLGVRLTIDDFGVGYSSITHLKRFPIDTFKMDRSFIREIPQDSEGRAIAEAIIAMGKSLNLTVVAEGVETLEQETFLRDHACDETQGYYFSRPIAGDRFAELLRRRIESSKQ